VSYEDGYGVLMMMVIVCDGNCVLVMMVIVCDGASSGIVGAAPP
jgi:hypothetical protein